MKRKVLAACMTLFALSSLGQQKADSDDFHLGELQELNWNQTIAKSPLPRKEKVQLIATIKAQLIGDSKAEDEEASQQHLDQTEIKFVDLQGIGPHELVAQATGQYLCSPTGNCSLWVLARKDKKYQVVLEGNAQTFAIQSTVTNGWHDIVLGMHGSAFETQLTLYKFEGKKYSPYACFMAIFPQTEENQAGNDEARITPCR